MSINIKIEKKELWLIAAIIVFLVGVGYVIAYDPSGSGNPAIMGHSLNELEKCPANKVLKMDATGTNWQCLDDDSGGSSASGTVIGGGATWRDYPSGATACESSLLWGEGYCSGRSFQCRAGSTVRFIAGDSDFDAGYGRATLYYLCIKN